MSVDPRLIRETAESYYRNGDYYCSEAIVKTIRDAFKLDVPDTAIAMASGFPIGMGGAGCTCGAIVGGIMALGMFFGRTEPQDPKVELTMKLSKELHDQFRTKHKRLCCRILTKGMELGSPMHMEQCIAFTGEVAEETTKLILRELSNK
jgi:C_GCAxxG_C_C family probable redox protein